MSLRKLTCLPLIVFLLASTALPTSSQSSIVGIWDFELDITHMVARDGFVKKERHFFEWVIRFRRNGNELTGDLIGGKTSRGESVCADAAIEGSIMGAEHSLRSRIKVLAAKMNRWSSRVILVRMVHH
jgi:hypothetical protein